MSMAVTMITINRFPRENYLHTTLDNLFRGGLSELQLFNGYGLSPSANAARALRAGALAGQKWVLFLEDDIDVCADFIGSVERWLDHCPEHRIIYSLGSTFHEVTRSDSDSHWCDYPIDYFYGTQAFAVKSYGAFALAGWIESNPGGRLLGEYDLMIADYARERKVDNFIASCPSFVQHIGRDSIINPRESTHTFDTWLGREWSFGQ